MWIAAALANERPADAERVFQLIEESPPNQLMSRSHIALWLCGPMAKADPKRAERLIAEMKTPAAQACGWAVLALQWPTATRRPRAWPSSGRSN